MSDNAEQGGGGGESDSDSEFDSSSFVLQGTSVNFEGEASGAEQDESREESGGCRFGARPSVAAGPQVHNTDWVPHVQHMMMQKWCARR